MRFFLLIVVLLQTPILTSRCPTTPQEVTRIGGEVTYWQTMHEDRDGSGQLLGINFLYQGQRTTFAPEGGGTLQLWTPSGSGSPVPMGRQLVAEEVSYSCSNILSTPNPSPVGDMRQLRPQDIAYGCIDQSRCQESITLFQGANQQEVVYEGEPVDILVTDHISFFVVDNGTPIIHTGVGPMVVHQIIRGTFTLLPQE